MLGSQQSSRAIGPRGQLWLMLALLAMLLAAACGSRLPDDVLAKYDEGNLSARGQQLAGSDSGSGSDTDSGEFASGDDSSGDETASGGDSPGTDSGGSSGIDGGSTNGGDGRLPQASSGCRGGATDKGVTANEVRVAGMVTASGPLPGATEGAYRGAAAYFAKVNAAGGICGRKITILKGDDGLDPQRARAEFLRLEPQVVAFVGNLAVADSGYIDQIEKTGVPYLGSTVDPAGRTLPNVLPKTKPNVANTGPFVYYWQKYKDVRRVGFLFSDVGGVRANTPASREPLKRVGYEIVRDSGVRVTDPDYTAEVIALQRANVDMLYLFALEVNMHVRLARNMRQQNWEPKLKVSQIGYNSKLIELLGPVANEWSNHLAYLPVLNESEPKIDANVREFLEWNKRLFPGGQIDLFPVGGWADAHMFVDALAKVGANVTRKSVIAAINSFDEQAWGVDAPVNPSTGGSSTCFVIARVENAKWVREYPSRGYECDMGEIIEF